MVRVRLCVTHYADDLLSLSVIDVGVILSVPVVAEFQVQHCYLTLSIAKELNCVDVLISIGKFVVLNFDLHNALWVSYLLLYNFPGFSILTLHHRGLEPI